MWHIHIFALDACVKIDGYKIDLFCVSLKNSFTKKVSPDDPGPIQFIIPQQVSVTRCSNMHSAKGLTV